MDCKLMLVKRDIAGDTILVPVGDASLKLKGLITLNETGSFLWDVLPDAAGPEELVDRLEEEFDADRPTLEADVAAFLAELTKWGIL